ncbi:aspartate ammonia-lyase [Uliginosibacterium gangwonense]|uniref:aspartate ammonia-lyase n=1 Tax=Uliginosibacterium gangwonense TaxID=392736 RepID=UPI00036B1BC6|nr:aspartate ammonia-lyase [Uliginosibacterium gangwonense]
MDRVRIESDSLGEYAVPAQAWYGIHTARALENFHILGQPVAIDLVAAMAEVKIACARTNTELGYLDAERAGAIVQACEKVIAGEFENDIVVDALQGGAGTSLNMNLNEVIANRAEVLLGGERGQYLRVHPLDHVNLHQSTNDVFPTALRIAAIRGLHRLEHALVALQTALQDKEQAFAAVVKLGRTQLQDACPTTLGASFAAWAEAIGRDRWRVFKCEERLRVVNLGGTAIGTGLAAPREYIFRVVERLREQTRLGLARAENLVEATQNTDAFVEVSGILKAHSVNLFKISSDLRLLASGPRGGLGELRLPAVQVGSSLMPGKVNPVICEAVAQAAMYAMSQDMAVTLAAQSGQLELNAFLPLLAHGLLGSLNVLTQACISLREKCVLGIEADPDRCKEHLENSLGTATALVPVLGYECVAELAHEARRTGESIRALVLRRGLLSAVQADQYLCAEAMTSLGFRAARAEPVQ